MSIGTFGDIVFTSSADFTRTFSNLQQRSGARYTEHAVLGRKPKLEFVGAGLEEISFRVQLMRALGVDPDKEFKSLQRMRDSGEVALLIFGDTKIGKFCVTDISSKEGPRTGQGEATWIDVDLTIKEYA